MNRIVVISLAATLMGTSTSATFASNFSADDIRGEIVGRPILLASPFDGEFSLNYRRNGVVDGDGEALGLGRFVQPFDKGRWWISGNRICHQFASWYGVDRRRVLAPIHTTAC